MNSKNKMKALGVLLLTCLVLGGCSLLNSTCKFPKACCKDELFTRISIQELKDHMINYRDDIWSKTSPIFTKGTVNGGVVYRDDPSQTDNSNILFNPLHNGTLKPEDLDSRFVDFTIAELKNYICAVENQTIDGTVTPNVVRFYFIKYGPDGTVYDFASSFEGKHSLAMVPVEKDLISGKTTKELTKEVEIEDPTAPGGSVTYNLIATARKKSMSANHNELCPPLVGCEEKTMIVEIGG